MASTPPVVLASVPPSLELRESYYSGAGLGSHCGTTDPSFLTRTGHILPAEKDLANGIFAILQRSGLPWIGFNVLRIGYHRLKHRLPPRQLFIEVEAGKVEWDAGVGLAQKCRSQMVTLGLDVHCEVYFKLEVLEARIEASSTASPPSPSNPGAPADPFFWPIERRCNFIHSWDDALLPFTSALGQSVATNTSGHATGSVSFYVGISANSRRYNCLFSSRHALLDDKTSESIDRVSSAGSSTGDGLKEVELTVDHKERIADVDDHIRALEQLLGEPCLSHALRIEQGLPCTECSLNRRNKQDFQTLKDFLEFYMRRGSDRTIGHILLAPPIETVLAKSGTYFRRDWAAVYMDPSKTNLDDHALPKNELCTASDEGRKPFHRHGIMRDSLGESPSMASEKVTIEHYLTIESLQRQLKNSRSTSPLQAVKVGAGTYFTSGPLNSVPYFCNAGNNKYTTNMCIVGAYDYDDDDDEGDPKPSLLNVFSRKTDVGSLVSLFCGSEEYYYDDMKTVVAAGVLWGGNYCPGDDRHFGLSYATPLAYILDDVKKCFAESTGAVDEAEVVLSNLTPWARSG
ncbi:hypothetical protein F5Y17DRAFT_478609 [Xylariaceae sp. FL0594]|nr:hypothetical protein F5Y17DRAFT_478609 [Xylariaceae sp. FL0594]